MRDNHLELGDARWVKKKKPDQNLTAALKSTTPALYEPELPLDLLQYSYLYVLNN
jgi:hypothetical protein